MDSSTASNSCPRGVCAQGVVESRYDEGAEASSFVLMRREPFTTHDFTWIEDLLQPYEGQEIRITIEAVEL